MMNTKVEQFIHEQMAEENIVGLAAAIVKDGKLAWSKGFGWADIATQRPMDATQTVQNVGSVSKTITATAIMQLVERSSLLLDAPINDYLPFQVEHPHFTQHPITTRQLLIHRSGIKDGAAYEAIYELGDPSISLEDWIRGYLVPDGRFYDADDNFHAWHPGDSAELPKTPRNYSNVGYGLLGYLVEVVSGQSFISYCQDHIFAPLGMEHSTWLLSNTDLKRHATLYVVDDEDEQEEIEQYRQLGFFRPKLPNPTTAHQLHPLNLYGFANYPDGLLRTSATQLARFLAAIMNGGMLDGVRILQATTVAQLFTIQTPSDPKQGLCWSSITRQSKGDQFWYHDGGDPGISTFMFFRPADQIGVILFSNSAEVNMGPILMHLFDNVDHIL